ncbi:MAG: sulfotransferase domain-containing protein [Sphingobacteriaceae bacterium]|nr:sulfotransferase domain-containing protein [Sphingobacteriaceae bacterium]
MTHIHSHLIIAGTTKSATSSIFFYLSKHPEVNPSFYKETRFFLEESYPLYRPYAYSDKLADYLKLFTSKQDSLITMEATPDYLYSTDTPQKIHQMLGNAVKIIFILRNPTERMVSWYRFAKQMNEIGDISFEEFLKIQTSDNTGKQHQRVLIQGNYSNYLANWFTYFTNKQVKIIFFDELKDHEKDVLISVANFLEINPAYFENYDFQKINQTQEIKLNFWHKLFTLYRNQKKKIRKYSYDSKIQPILSKLNYWVESFYFKANKKQSSEVIGQKEYQFLKTYYQADKIKLEILLNKTIKW